MDIVSPLAIKEGFEKIEASTKYDNLYYAGFSRAIRDWLLGMNATRLYTVKYGGYSRFFIGRKHQRQPWLLTAGKR